MNLFLLIAKGMDHDIPDPRPFIELAEYLGEQEVTPLDIIDRLQESGFSQVTHIGNEHMKILLGRICAKLKQQNLDCSYYVNALDTHLHVNGNKIQRLEDIRPLIDGNR